MNTTFKTWLHANFDYITGFGVGQITGFITLPNLYSALFTIIMAFLTGAAGATAAHLIRLLFDKLKKPKNG